MDKELISLQPQIIQFGVDQKQLIKITNRTNQVIQNCFFCLFNTNKYQFSPDTFSLQPKQHKLVSVTLKLKIADSPIKQFAYLKAKNINKRITLMSNTPPELLTDEKLRSPMSGVDDLNTLSSRDYRQQQKFAYDKVVAEKQAYIQRLERKLQEQQLYIQKQRQSQSANKTSKFYIDQISSLQLKVDILIKQKEQLVRQNIEIQGKFKQYRILMESDGKSREQSQKIADFNKQISSQAEQIKYLQHQCEQFLKKISQKQTKLRQLELSYVSKIDNIINQSEKKFQQIQSKYQQQKKQSQKIDKQLKQSRKQAQSNKHQIKLLQSELSKKQKQINDLSSRVESNNRRKKQQDQEKKKRVKIQIEKDNLHQQNKQLKEKVKGLEMSLDQLKQQTIIYKSKIVDQDSSAEKLSHYLQMALQSCKNQNETLKKSQIQLQKILNQNTKTRNQIQTKLADKDEKIKSLNNQISRFKQQKQSLVAEKMKQQEDLHDKLMKIKSENIDLIQKMNTNKKDDTAKQQQLNLLKDKVKKYEQEIHRLEKQNLKAKQQQLHLKIQLAEAVQAKQKITKRIQKCRKQAKKQIKSIHESAKDELKKIQIQKNMLEKKVQELQISAQNTEGLQIDQNETRHKTRTQYQATPSYLVRKPSLSHQGDRKTGIKNQRKQLQESNANSRTSVDMDKIYTELGQLRQFKNYVNNQIRKVGSYIDLDESKRSTYDQNVSSNPIFTVINFFRELESRLQNKIRNTQKLNQAQKQIQFLKGRLTQLEPFAKKLRQKQKEPDQSSIEFHSKVQVDKSIVEYIQQEMRSQYKKLHDTIKLSQQKFSILKKKIYEQYRLRIIQLLTKKDKDEYTVNKIQAILQRFIDGLANTSHKQAILAKQIKLKQEARKQASLLKNKLVNLNKEIQKDSKNVYCSRTAAKTTFQLFNQVQWLDNIKLQAKMLTYEAQNARLIQQMGLLDLRLSSVDEQLKSYETDIIMKQRQVEKLKKEIISISTQSQKQIAKQDQELNTLKKKFVNMQKMQKQIVDLTMRDKQNTHLRSELQQKRQAIKQLRQRQKLLQQLLQSSKRNQSTVRDREKRQFLDQSRMQQSLRQLKENNRELRTQNAKLRQQIDNLMQQLNKKNAALKRLKSQGQQHRIKNLKSQQNSLQKLKSQILQLKDQIKKSKQEYQKLKRKKEKDNNEKQSELDKMANQFAIQKSSLQSIIRALIDTMSGIYCSLDILARKKGKILSQTPNFEDLIKNSNKIKSTKIGQLFQEVIQALKE